jgi:hypothetical protein
MPLLRVPLRVVLVAALLAFGMSCADDTSEPTATSEPAADNVLKIVEREYEFAVSGTPSAGTLTVDVSNEGKEWHELAMAKLLDGKTIEDLRTALEGAEEDEDPFEGIADESAEAVDDLGGSQFPGTTYAITGSDIVPGEYALLCFVPNAEGKPHWSLGMLTGFTIGDEESDASPEADVTFTADAERLEGPEQVDAGETSMRIVNDSGGTRELGLLRVKDGRTLDDVYESLEAAEDAPPDPSTAPFDYFAYVFDAEQDRTITVDLTPGTWALQAGDPEDESTKPLDEDPFVVVFTVS